MRETQKNLALNSVLGKDPVFETFVTSWRRKRQRSAQWRAVLSSTPGRQMKTSTRTLRTSRFDGAKGNRDVHLALDSQTARYG